MCNKKTPYFTEKDRFARNLVCAVIVQAIIDWQEDIKAMNKGVFPTHLRCRSKKKAKNIKRVNDDIAEIVEFLSSGICEKLGIDHKLLIENIESIEIPVLQEKDMSMLVGD